jgi:hypothetical protein
MAFSSQPCSMRSAQRSALGVCMPGGTPLFLQALRMVAMAASYSGKIGSSVGARPSEQARSFGPTKQASMPGTDRISSALRTPSADSIIRMTMISSLACST